MTTKPITLKEVKTEKDLLAFIRLPWEIYKGDPYWVPPLVKDQLQKLSTGNPFRCAFGNGPLPGLPGGKDRG